MTDTLWTPDGDRETTRDTPAAGDPAPGRPLVSRRNFLRIGASGAAAVGMYAAGATLGPSLASRGFLSANGVFGAASVAFADGVIKEVFPVSPLVLNPF